MRIAAIEIRTAGPRAYENAVIDIGAVVLDDDEIVAGSEFHCYLSPNQEKSYRMRSLSTAGLTLDKLSDVGASANDAVARINSWLDVCQPVLSLWSQTPGEINAFLNALYYTAGEINRLPEITDAKALCGTYAALAKSETCVITGDYGFSYARHSTALDKARSTAVGVARLVRDLVTWANTQEQPIATTLQPS